MADPMKLSDYVIDFLKENEIDHGYFMIGGALGHIADSCHRNGIQLFTMHHEQAAAFAAEGQAIVTSKIGFAMATSGPGATNLITGIGSAYFASLPVLYITGQVNTFESNLSGKRRQAGFQETDIISMIKNVTKYAVLVDDPKTIAYHMEKAVFLARNGRMGPVLIDLPFNIQGADIDPSHLAHFKGSDEEKALLSKDEFPKDVFERIAGMIKAAERPLILVGHGAKLSHCEEQVIELARVAKIPVVSTLLGTDVFPNDNPLYFGFIGTYGQRFSNFAVANSDLLIVLGSRLDSRQTGVKWDFFAPMAKIIHVDADTNELGATVHETVSIKGDCRRFLSAFLRELKPQKERSEWVKFLLWLKKTYPEVKQDIASGAISPIEAIRMISSKSDSPIFVAADVGSNQMWFAQAWTARKGHVIATNGGMGPMGYSLPVSIGACLSSPGMTAISFCGDGGMQINIQELQTLKRHKLPVKIVILNNNSLGMLTQFQTENFEGRLIGSVEGYDAPDFVKVASAYGIPSRRSSKSSSLPGDIDWLLSGKGPALLEVMIPRNFWVLPKSVFSRPVYDMKPFLGEEELKKALKYVDTKKIGK